MGAYDLLRATRRAWRIAHMPAVQHHSPSSLATAKLCRRKWYYDHVLRLRAPEVTWAQIEAWGDKWQEHCSSRQRSAARGTAVHAVLESYYEGGAPDWSTYIGQLAMAMRLHLPARERCLEIRVEKSIGADPYPHKDDPNRTALVIDGARFLGYVDLEVRLDPNGAEAKRLGLNLHASDGWATFDYKTSKDVEQYALTPEAAATDGQGLLYSEAGMIRTSTAARPMRWVYVQTEGRRYAKPVDALFRREGNSVHLRPFVDLARELNQVTNENDCPPEPSACSAYGGCPHHERNGGPCFARMPLGRLLPMGFRDKYLAQNGGAPATTTTTETPPVAEPPAQPPTATPKPWQKQKPVGPEPTPEPAGANGPAAIEAANRIAEVNAAREQVAPGPEKKPRAKKDATLGEKLDDLLTATAAELGCDTRIAARVLAARLDQIGYAPARE